MLYRLAVLTMSILTITGCGDAPRTPLANAAAYGSAADVKMQLQNATAGQIQSAIITAARYGNRTAIRMLVKAGANPNEPAGVNSWPPLMHAIHKNQLGAVKELLNSGADVNYRRGKGQTPLIMAAGYGYTDMVAVLCEEGADGTGDIARFTIRKCRTGIIRSLLIIVRNLPGNVRCLLGLPPEPPDVPCVEIEKMLQNNR